MADWREQYVKWANTKLPRGEFRLLLFDETLVAAGLTCLAANRSGSLLVILPDTAAMETAAMGLANLLPILGETRRLIPLPTVALNRRMWIPENEAGRSAALEAALSGEVAIYLATAPVLLSHTIAPKKFRSASFTLKKGNVIAPTELAEKLVALDYDNELEVHDPGEFSRRGGIFDVYSPLYESPVRIEFWGDEIDSLRFFMPDTQRSYQEVEELRIVPRGSAVVDTEETATAIVKDFFPKDIQAVLVDPVRISECITAYADAEASAGWENMQAQFRKPVEFVIRPDDVSQEDGKKAVRLSAVSLGTEMTEMIPELGDGAALWHWQQLRDSMARWCSSGYTVVACCSEKGEVDRFRELLSEDAQAAALPVMLENQRLSEGLLLPDAHLVLLSSQELFGRKEKGHRKKILNYRHDNSLSEEMELEEGSYVVHVTHGIAIFRGIKMLESSGDVQEVMELEFEDEARLYVPLEQSFLVSRYMGAGKSSPKLSRLGAAAWRKAKADAADAAWDFAAELLRIEALRENSTGSSLKPSLEWERSFANSFPFTETPDQAAAIQAVLQDLESPKPMDRLLCGDVGYGKTEVAIRAAFRAVLNGKQVAVLVPTTVLAQQHYQTFKERMAEYPVSIEVLSRFRSPKQQREIMAKAAAGEVDIVIGTHRLLSKDMKFHSLGLLVIDEEQRFGVNHKQRLKAMRADLDILTMTATPIPRTLYFSLSGIRNLSTIMTAPVDRLPVTTIVANYDKELIRLALTRELERQGQVFFLYNRVRTIENMRDVLLELVPNARIGIGHGQMADTELEDVMMKFVNHEIDILLCTTIIESGVDIPNVNTIIIDRADRFGLSELYQLRGRVGRHDRQAYAYMLLPPMGQLAQNARERLSAIRRYTHLGAGFKLAMRDLEIRGAGNILGTEQSGHIAAVGFELYCQLLKDAVNGLCKRTGKEKQQCVLSFDRLAFAVKAAPGRTAVGFPPDYIGDLNARIECYKRINGMKQQSEVDAFREELIDRFGSLPEAAIVLLEYHSLRILATVKGLVSITVTNGRLLIETGKGLLRDSSRQLPTFQVFDGHAQLLKTISFISHL